jgi:hypothetical protein
VSIVSELIYPPKAEKAVAFEIADPLAPFVEPVMPDALPLTGLLTAPSCRPDKRSAIGHYGC